MCFKWTNAAPKPNSFKDKNEKLYLIGRVPGIYRETSLKGMTFEKLWV